jgi:transposase
MSVKNKKTYTPEFKESSVKLALESKNTITQIARELGVNVNTLRLCCMNRIFDILPLSP